MGRRESVLMPRNEGAIRHARQYKRGEGRGSGTIHETTRNAAWRARRRKRLRYEVWQYRHATQRPYHATIHAKRKVLFITMKPKDLKMRGVFTLLRSSCFDGADVAHIAARPRAFDIRATRASAICTRARGTPAEGRTAGALRAMRMRSATPGSGRPRGNAPRHAE